MVDQILVHHGILGMKWGVRRFQNKDGSLTVAGKARRDTTSADKPSAPPTKTSKVHVKKPSEQARHIIEDPISRDEINRSRDLAAVKKHVTFDKNGKVTGISKELEKYFGVPLSEIDDMDFVVYQAMVLEALKEY